jgi:large subunit ribosomal protein L9
MKFILLKDVPRVGARGVIIDVAQAYGINAFVNKGLAKIATTADIKAVETKEKIRKENKEKEADKFIEVFTKLTQNPLVILKKLDTKGHTYTKLSAQEIADAIYKLEKLSINPKQVTVPDLHELGTAEAQVEANGKKYKLVVKIEKE